VRQYHARLIAGLAKKLQAVKEGDGTMLDNTLIVYLSDSGDGHHPTGYEWPMLLLGDLGGTLKTRGRFLQLPTYGQKGHRTTANLYATLLHAAGKPRDTFGVADPGLRDLDQSGVVNELLV
jgi:arylsulfatase A-like enzyme